MCFFLLVHLSCKEGRTFEPLEVLYAIAICNIRIEPIRNVFFYKHMLASSYVGLLDLYNKVFVLNKMSPYIFEKWLTLKFKWFFDYCVSVCFVNMYCLVCVFFRILVGSYVFNWIFEFMFFFVCEFESVRFRVHSVFRFNVLCDWLENKASYSISKSMYSS